MNKKQQSKANAWSQEQITSFLTKMHIPMRFACITTTGWPLVISLWYLYEGGRFYCATQKTAKIVAHLTKAPRCAFEIAADQPPYRGVRGQGKVAIVPERGTEVLSRLLERYEKGTTSSLAQRLLARSHQEVAIAIEPVTLTTWDYTERMRGSLLSRT